MYPIGIVGDVHIDSRISSRKDNYFNTCILKIEEVASMCSNVIFLGDVFNRSVIPNDYMYNFYIALTQIKNKYNNTFYSIIGNHDIANEDEDNLCRSSLGLCSITGLINIITPDKPININGYYFYTSYVNFDKCLQHLSTLRLKSEDILLLHHYFEDGFDDIPIEHLKGVGCKRIFLGHEHTPFKGLVKKREDDLYIYRCGSLLRNTANSANLNRDIYFYTIDQDEVNSIKLNNVQPASQVFVEKALNQENLQKKKFVKSIQEVIDKYQNNVSTQSKFSINKTLQEINTPEHCMKYIVKKYNMINEVFS